MKNLLGDTFRRIITGDTTLTDLLTTVANMQVNVLSTGDDYITVEATDLGVEQMVDAGLRVGVAQF